MRPLPALGPLLAAALLSAPLPALGQGATDIWVLPLREAPPGLSVGEAVRATNRDGYDNQPAFVPGGRFLLFTSIDASGQADIHRFDLQSRQSAPLIRTTPESEYSATPMPGGARISVIRVEADSTQRLWSFDMAGGDPRLVLPDIAPVGYHAWIDDQRLALFVLGSPATLQLAGAGPGEGRVVARNIGRSLHRIPGTTRVSFVQLSEGETGTITELDPDSGATRPLAPLLEGNEYYAWTPGGNLLMGRGSVLHRWSPDSPGRWEELVDLSSAGIRQISRIAVSPEGGWIAVVGAH